jgi:hypothetical protein
MATGTLSTVARSLPVGGVDVACSAALMVHVARSRWDRRVGIDRGIVTEADDL